MPTDLYPVAIEEAVSNKYFPIYYYAEQVLSAQYNYQTKEYILQTKLNTYALSAGELVMTRRIIQY